MGTKEVKKKQKERGKEVVVHHINVILTFSQQNVQSRLNLNQMPEYDEIYLSTFKASTGS